MRVPPAPGRLLAALCLFAVPCLADAAELRGTLAPRTGAVPAGAEVSVALRETASASRLGRTVAEQRFVAQGGAAEPFTLAFGPEAVRAGAGYALSVRVTQQGRLLWHNVERVSIDPARPARALTVPLVAVETPSQQLASVQPQAAPPPARAKVAEPETVRTPVARELGRAPLPTPPVPPLAALPAAQPAVSPSVAAAPPPAAAVASPAPDPAAATTAAELAPSALRCQGNEPGWTLISHAGQLRLRTQEAGVRELNMNARYSSAPWADTPFGVLRGEAQGQGVLVAFLTAERCQDSMADESFPMRARVSMPDGSLRAGCCRPVHADSDPRRPDDWSRLLPELIGVVQACAVARPGTVLAAWPMNQGKAGVRIGNGDGNRFDCVGDVITRRAERIMPVANADRMPGEGRPVLRPGQPARPEACRVVETVRGTDGALFGSLAWESCR